MRYVYKQSFSKMYTSNLIANKIKQKNHILPYFI